MRKQTRPAGKKKLTRFREPAVRKARQTKQFAHNNAANCLTLFNLIFGVCAILSAIHGHYRWSVAFIGFAGIADRYDGVVARHLGTDSPLGVQLDSLGDAVSFGVAPALLTYLIFQPQATSAFVLYIHVFVCVFFISCGVFRLARFNITGVDAKGNYQGVPILSLIHI